MSVPTWYVPSPKLAKLGSCGSGFFLIPYLSILLLLCPPCACCCCFWDWGSFFFNLHLLSCLAFFFGIHGYLAVTAAVVGTTGVVPNTTDYRR